MKLIKKVHVFAKTIDEICGDKDTCLKWFNGFYSFDNECLSYTGSNECNDTNCKFCNSYETGANVECIGGHYLSKGKCKKYPTTIFDAKILLGFN